jgi:cryptochrome
MLLSFDTFKVFEEWLLDADWSLNAANWQWLSASAFFHQYFRVYSPIAFGKKTDKNGDYIRKYLPVLKNMPAQYIYEPWMAPPSVQKIAKCIIGQDYPMCIVDHNIIHKKNIERMKKAYEGSSKAAVVEEDDEAVKEEKIEKVKPSTSASSKSSKSKDTKTKLSNITDFFQPKTSPDSQPPNKKAKK